MGANNDVQGLNLYGYCANNPIHRYDEAGDVWGAVLFGAMMSMTSQIVENIIEKEPWYKNVVGATVGGALSVAFGGIGGIMLSNAVSISLNHIELNICGYGYSDTDVAWDLVGNVLLDAGSGLITGTLFDSKIDDDYFDANKYDEKYIPNNKNNLYKKHIKQGMEMASTLVDNGVKTTTIYMFDKQKRDKLHAHFFG